jgi:hypothetical protein
VDSEQSSLMDNASAAAADRQLLALDNLWYNPCPKIAMRDTGATTDSDATMTTECWMHQIFWVAYSSTGWYQQQPGSQGRTRNDLVAPWRRENNNGTAANNNATTSAGADA